MHHCYSKTPVDFYDPIPVAIAVYANPSELDFKHSKRY
jgi:hypothetical protein